MKKFQEVIAQLEQALCDFPYNELDISDEVREQVTSTTRLNKIPLQSLLSAELQF
jgi:hypothetical protein